MEAARARREAAQNHLEEYIIETRMRMDESSDYYVYASADDREKITAAVAEAGNWMDEEAGFDTKTEVLFILAWRQLNKYRRNSRSVSPS